MNKKKLLFRRMLNIAVVVKKIIRAPLVLLRMGLARNLQIIYVYFFSPIVTKLTPICLEVYLRVRRIMDQCYNIDKQIRYWRCKKDDLLRFASNGYKTKIEELGLDGEKIEFIKDAQKGEREVVIADIDQDGFMLSFFGTICNLPSVSRSEWAERKRFALKLVAIDGYLGVKKNYNGNKLFFLNELRALYFLGLANCNVPGIMDVDFDKLTITFSYILGDVLREELAKKGAILRDRDVIDDPDFLHLDQNETIDKYAQEGRRFLRKVVNAQFVEELFVQMKRLHKARFIWNDIKYGNVIIEKKSGRPYLIDFNSTRYCPKLEKSIFRILRDRDIEKFNLWFGTEKLTYNRVKNEIKKIRQSEVYAPVYFGAGLKIGNIWGNGHGYGRWHYILKKNLPSLSGKRILDLGANNAFTGIQMLRNGAREVIGVELDNKYMAQGEFVRSSFEYMDNRQYAFKYIQANMKDLPRMNLGEFDMVLALCSIYYLDDDEIFKLVRYIGTITDIFVLQCNIATDLDRPNLHAYRKAHPDYILECLASNGFSAAKVFSPRKYTRPLIVARKRMAHNARERAIENFNLDRTVNETIQVYENRKKTILHIVKLVPKKLGSFEEYIIALANKLQKNGDDVVIAFENDVPDELRYRYQGIKTTSLSQKKGPMRFYYKLFRVMRKYRPDIVHLSFYPIFSFLTLWLHVFGGKNIIFSDRVSGEIRQKKGLKKLVVFLKNKITGRFVEKIICVSNYVLERNKNFIPGIDPAKVGCIFNGVNLSRFKPIRKDEDLCREFNIDKDSFLVVNAAHLIKDKGVDYLIRAASSLLRNNKNMFFLIAGTGSEEANLRAMVKQMNLEEKIRFVGLRNDIEKVLSLSDVFVYPSIWQEACGWGILEAIACGVPVVTTNVGGTPEMIEDGVNGLLIEPADEYAIVESIERLYKDEELCRQLRKNARYSAEKRFDLNRVVSETMAQYRKCL